MRVAMMARSFVILVIALAGVASPCESVSPIAAGSLAICTGSGSVSGSSTSVM